ncbi:MAG: hypothetical protein AMXMBFR84_42730 [Candidatus Hydrogenedentota bacterium]
MTLATSSWDPRSWFALYRYGGDFAGTATRLRFYEGVLEKDPRLTAVASEEVATGITCYILREHFGLDHIADAYACIQRGELVYVNPPLQGRPDYFCEDSRGETVLAESKGSTGTNSSITQRIDPEGLAQVQNVRPVSKPLRGTCSRVVIGTHFCVESRHPRSETTTIVRDPEGEPSQERNPNSDMVVRLAYAKALRFMGHDVLAARLIARRPFPETFPPLEDAALPRLAGLPVLILGESPFGDAIGFYGPTIKALFARSTATILESVNRSLLEFKDQRARLEPLGYGLPNGVVVIHEPDELT